MSALVEIWRSEVAKLGQRSPWGVGSKVSRQHKKNDRKEEEEAVVDVIHKGEKVKASSDAGQRRCYRTSTLSEATVCMLMDRFAPC